MNPKGIEIQRLAQKMNRFQGEHFCPVCQLLINPNAALKSMCGHLYCKSCLLYIASTTWTCPYDGYFITETDAKPLMESNKMLADTIGKTLVYCSYQNSGCQWVGSLADDSLFHCSKCAFGNSHVMCFWCGTHIAQHQWQEHVQICHGAYNQTSIVMATTQASAQGHGVSAATLTQEQWYQQPYQQYYQNYIGDYTQHQPMQCQSFSPQNQVIYEQAGPAVHYVAQTDQYQTQPHDVFPLPQVNTVQESLAQSFIGQCQSNQQHASWTGLNPQPNQTNQVEDPPNNIVEYHQDHYPEQVTYVRPPQSLPTIQKQPLLPSKLTRDQYMRQQVLMYRGESVPESSDTHSLQQLLSEPSLPQQQTAASTTGVVHNQMHHEGPSYSPDIACLQSRLHPIELVQGLQKHPQTFQEHQPIPTILGVQANMNHFSATAPQVGLGHAAMSSERIPSRYTGHHWAKIKYFIYMGIKTMKQ